MLHPGIGLVSAGPQAWPRPPSTARPGLLPPMPSMAGHPFRGKPLALPDPGTRPTALPARGRTASGRRGPAPPWWPSTWKAAAPRITRMKQSSKSPSSPCPPGSPTGRRLHHPHQPRPAHSPPPMDLTGPDQYCSGCPPRPRSRLSSQSRIWAGSRSSSAALSLPGAGRSPRAHGTARGLRGLTLAWSQEKRPVARCVR
jgi:hypothetical protein